MYVLRNPKDQAVSCFHFFNNLPYKDAGAYKDIVSKDWNTWIETYLSGKPTKIIFPN